MNFRNPSLHVTIVTLFLVSLFTTAGCLTWFNYRQNTTATIEIADELLDKISEQVSGRVRFLFESTTQMTDEVAELSHLSDKPDFMSHPVQWLLAQILEANPHLYSVYIGYVDGEFYQIIALPSENAHLHQLLSAPADARLAVRRVFKRMMDNRRVELWEYFDKERRIVGSRSIRLSRYDPRKRPWFQEAIGQEGIIKTGFYIFESTDSMGMTFAHRFDGEVPGVFGADITLAGLSDYFAHQRVGDSGYVFMFNRDLQITAHPDPTKILTVTEMPEGKRAVRLSLGDLHDPVMIALKERMQGWDGKKFRMIIRANSESYLIHVDPVSDGLMDEQYLAVAAPLKDFTGKMDKTREQSLLFAAVIILLAVPLAVYNARLMSRPLNTLAVEADKIRHFDLDSRVDVQSHIAEIAGLSKAVKAMQMSLSSFGRYVPKTLVERLLLAGKSPELGGERREATLLFTDIADFTTISESMGAEELMLTVSEYLQEVGSVIISHGGTIDKYIGDSIMAFWNAPNAQENHAALACEAALQACAVSEAINARWELQGKPVMHTRFGLHTGRPVIGNVGSDDRMNYTAMGAAVNLASRLEGLNKYYGTQILVSEAVKEQAGGDFMFRPVGKVLPKGTVSPVIAYELMGYSGVCTGIVTMDGRDTCFLDLWERGYAAYQDQRFSEAAEIFKTCFDVKPEDHLAASMMQRAVYLAENSPEDDWDGVDVFKVK